MEELIEVDGCDFKATCLSSATGACAAVAAAAPDGAYLPKGPVRRVFSGKLDPDWWDRSRAWI